MLYLFQQDRLIRDVHNQYLIKTITVGFFKVIVVQKPQVVCFGVLCDENAMFFVANANMRIP